MARTFLSSGDDASFGRNTSGWEVFGTNSNEIVNVIAGNTDILFDASFNRGGDTINVFGAAGSWEASIVAGSRLLLTNAATGASLDIPVGEAGVNITFEDTGARALKFVNGVMKFGEQTIPTTGVVDVEDGDVTPPPPGDEIVLTASTDFGGVYNGTAGSDLFYAPLSQNPGLGGVSNTLSSADRILGGAGNDRLQATLIPEFFSGVPVVIDVQPIIKSVENIQFEVRDIGGFAGVSSSSDQSVYVDAKNIADVVRIGSYYSDGDLVIENLTTLTSNGAARNTDAVIVTMDHTDNFDSDGDASDLHVYFDDDYLLAGQSRTTSQVNYFLLDEDSDDYVNEPLLNIEKNGVTLEIDGQEVIIEVTDNTVTGIPVTWEAYAQALRDDIAAQIAAGNTLLVGLTVVVDYNNTEDTFNDDGINVIIPAISIVDSQGRELTATGFVTPENATGSFDIYGTFNSDPSETFDNAVTVNIELEKVGRNGEGGDLIVGGKNGDKGIEVFNISVKGVGAEDPSNAVAKPSNLGTVASTGGALAEVFIRTDPAFAEGDTYASLEIRDGFGDNYDGFDNPAIPGGSWSTLTPNDLRLVDADAFFGDLLLGTDNAVVNLDTLVARGGGDVTFYGELNGDEVAQLYSYTTGAGEDFISLDIDGDALDFAQSSVTVVTGDGDDVVEIDFFQPNDAEILNQAVLANVSVDTGAGNDIVRIVAPSAGNTTISTGSGNDQIYTTGGAAGDVWVFNFDDTANPAPTADWEDFQGIVPNGDGSSSSFGDLDIAGQPLSLNYLSGATITVAFSGAGTDDINDGGGVMAVTEGADADAIESLGSLDGFINGYESRVQITQLINGNKHYGDQRDVNAAILRAINEDEVLNKLIEAKIGPNNTLLVGVRPGIGGNFQEGDLEITISRQHWTNTANGNSVLTEARRLSQNSALTIEDLYGPAPSVNSPYGSPAGLQFGEVATDNDFYTGVGVDAAYQSDNSGFAGNFETDNIINAGAGDDLIVLSTVADGFDLPYEGSDFTVGPFNSLWNGASNETIVLEDVFGNDTVMNFTTALGSEGIGSGASPQAQYQDGLDFLDFSDYLTSLEDLSVNSPAAPDNDVSNTLIPVTLQFDTLDVQANEVAVIQFTAEGQTFGTTGENFANLTDVAIERLFNNATNSAALNFGDDANGLLVQAFTADDEYGLPGDGSDPLVNTAKGILLVENGYNLGEYKVFELSWNGQAGADTDGTNNGIVDATLIGSLDFGTSLEGLDEINLVGSTDYLNLLLNGFGSSVAPL